METHALGIMTAWAARFSTADVASAARLRLAPSVRAAVIDGELWLRGHDTDAVTERLLALAAPCAIYRVDAELRLFPPGHLLPVGDLPGGDWKPLIELLAIEHTPALEPATVPARVPLRTVRFAKEQPATALLADFGHFADWCDTAPAIRLAQLRFARRGSLALVLGTPLPHVAGTPHYESSGIVVPCGFTLSPAIDPPSLRARLGLPDGCFALFGEDGWELIPADAVAPLTRSGVRLARLGADA